MEIEQIEYNGRAAQTADQNERASLLLPAKRLANSPLPVRQNKKAGGDAGQNERAIPFLPSEKSANPSVPVRRNKKVTAKRGHLNASASDRKPPERLATPLMPARRNKKAGGDAGLHESAVCHLPDESQAKSKMPARRNTKAAKPSLNESAIHLVPDASRANDALPARRNSEAAPAGRGVVTDPRSQQFICLGLSELQNERRALAKRRLGLLLSIKSYVRRAVGLHADLPADKKREFAKVSSAVLKAKLADKPVEGVDNPHLYASLDPRIGPMREAMLTLAARQRQVEAQMVNDAGKLPGAKFVEGLHGFGFIGLAIIVGEAGDLSNYSDYWKLWKRLGLAVFGGVRQRLSSDADERKIMAFVPERRAAIYTVAASLIKAANPYQELYRQRRAYLLTDEHKTRCTVEIKNNMHAHLHAQRYVEKRLVRDLWRAWRDAVQGNETREPAVLAGTPTPESKTSGRGGLLKQGVSAARPRRGAASAPRRAETKGRAS